MYVIPAKAGIHFIQRPANGNKISYNTPLK
jgi:hypothetical protein